jgi:hypothetical protein
VRARRVQQELARKFLNFPDERGGSKDPSDELAHRILSEVWKSQQPKRAPSRSRFIEGSVRARRVQQELARKFLNFPDERGGSEVWKSQQPERAPSRSRLIEGSVRVRRDRRTRRSQL